MVLKKQEYYWGLSMILASILMVFRTIYNLLAVLKKREILVFCEMRRNIAGKSLMLKLVPGILKVLTQSSNIVQI